MKKFVLEDMVEHGEVEKVLIRRQGKDEKGNKLFSVKAPGCMAQTVPLDIQLDGAVRWLWRLRPERDTSQPEHAPAPDMDAAKVRPSRDATRMRADMAAKKDWSIETRSRTIIPDVLPEVHLEDEAAAEDMAFKAFEGEIRYKDVPDIGYRFPMARKTGRPHRQMRSWEERGSVSSRVERDMTR